MVLSNFYQISVLQWEDDMTTLIALGETEVPHIPDHNIVSDSIKFHILMHKLECA